MVFPPATTTDSIELGPELDPFPDVPVLSSANRTFRPPLHGDRILFGDDPLKFEGLLAADDVTKEVDGDDLLLTEGEPARCRWLKWLGGGGGGWRR